MSGAEDCFGVVVGIGFRAMKTFLGRWGAVMLCSAAWTCGVRGAESAVVFRAISFEAATQAAVQENKLIFIDFFTTWCEPCKRLDTLTWTDAAVGKLVGEKAVPLKLDAEKEGKALAQRYKIEAYPTLLLLKADGTELDRIVGFREPATFATEFALGAAGKNSVKRAEDAAANAAVHSAEAVRARYDLAKTLVRNNRPDEALAHFLWCFDEGMVAVPQFVGVRVSFLTGDLGKLAKNYPPAREALVTRRDRAKERFVGGEAAAGMEMAALNDALGEGALTLEMFDGMPRGDLRRRMLGSRIQPQLIASRRYAEVLEAMPAVGMMRLAEAALARASTTDASAGPRMATIRVVLPYVEVLAGCGETESARKLIKQVLAVNQSEETRALLRDVVKRAERPELLTDIVAAP